MTSHNDRPLWRVGTKTLAQELRRRADAESVQRAFLAECDTALLLAEVAVRGYAVTPPMVSEREPGTVIGYTKLVYRGRGKPLPYPLDDELGGAQDGIPEVHPFKPRYPSPILGKRWPPLADEDGPLPFEDRDE